VGERERGAKGGIGGEGLRSAQCSFVTVGSAIPLLLCEPCSHFFIRKTGVGEEGGVKHHAIGTRHIVKVR